MLNLTKWKAIVGALFLTIGSVSAQDIIVLNNNTADEIKAKVIEVTNSEVKYKKWTYQDGPTFAIATANIFVIKYQNGEKQTFNTPQVTAAPAQVQNPQPRNYYSQNTQPVQTPVVKEKKARPRYKPHFEGGINFGYALGLDDVWVYDGYEYFSRASSDAIVAEFTAGCRINPYVFVGGTTGIYYHYDMSSYVIPILPTAKLGYPINQKWSVYAEVGLGVGIGCGDYLDGAEFMYKVGPMFKVNDFNFGFHYSSPAEDMGHITFKIGWTF